MGRRTDKTNELKGVNGKTPQSLKKSINEKVNAAEEKVEEIEGKNKPKRGKIAELTKQLEEAAKRAEEAEKRAKEADKKTEEANKKIKELETLRDEYSKSFFKRNQELAAAEKRNIQLDADRNVTADALRTSQNRIKELEDSNNVYINGAKSLVNRQKALREENENIKKDYERVSKVNQDYRTQNSYLTEAIRQGTLKSPEEVAKAQKELESASESKAEEVKTDNSGTTEETVAPEAGEAKVEGEPKVNTEQATQEPKSEAKQTSTESSEMTPEEVYDYLSDKNNFKDAEQYFASGKDAYVGTNDKRIPKSWFDTFKENKDKNHKKLWFNKNNKDVFTASLRDKGLLEDLNKTPDRAETERVKAETAAKAEFDKSIKTMGNKLLGFMGKHPNITTALILTAGVPGAIKFINEFRNSSREQDIEDAQVSDSAFFGDSDDNEDYNGEPIEPGKVAEDIANAGQETAQAANTAEEQAAQTLQENLPQGVAGLINQDKGESPAATNASTPASTKASTAESAPTQGLPPVVIRNTPSANPDSSGMTYSQRVEAGQAPQEGSMVYNANSPDMVTAGLIDAMNQNPQAGSDAIGYGDLYDQNFIDYWAKRNPNLAYAVSQGRKS